MLEPLWGLKTVAIFDAWTVEHILTGISVGLAVKKKNYHVIKKILRRDHDLHIWYLAITGVLFVAYLWETIEHYLEIGLAGNNVEFWFQGVEFWANRMLSDPLMLVLGYLIARKYHYLVWPARVLSLIWLLVHIFIFPHSMYLHELF